MSRTKRVGLLALPGLVLAAFLIAPTFAQAPAGGPPPRVDISGDWAIARNEDQPHRVPGAELGDYTGLPVNDAVRQKADAWDASILSQPERQAQAHPAQYWMQGPQPALRIVKILDPTTQIHVAYAIAGGFGRADRIVWVDGRKHPSDFSEHTWDGFSTGEWEDGVLVTTTTHMKQGVIQRNGVAASPYGVLREHWFRHGLYLTMFSWLDDPIFLEEPLARTMTWAWDPTGNMGFGNPFEPVDELGDKPLGWVPFYPLGNEHREFGELHGLPYKATLGGRESIYPEYQLKLAEIFKEDAARKAAEEAARAKAAPARK